MVPEIEKARITEIHVRMDCNGCVQKIKKALHGINGIYNIDIDFPRQTLTVIGWADPEKIIKAIKKTRKIATICSHKEVDPPAPPPAPADDPQPETPPPANSPPASEPAPPAEQPKEAPPPPPPQSSETTTAPKEETITPPLPSVATAEPAQDQPPPPSEPPKDVKEIHILHHHPHQYYGYYSGGGHGFPRLQELGGPYHVATHNYNTHRPSSPVSEYLHGYQRSPATQYIEHARIEYVDIGEDNIYQGRDRRDGNQIITSIFSDENPNACTIS